MSDQKNSEKPFDSLRKAQEEEYFRKKEAEALAKLKDQKAKTDAAATKDPKIGNKT
jgi:shikimate kinase